MALVKFVQGTLAQYTGLLSKDADTLYFITDAQKIYKGDKLFSGGVFTSVVSFPEKGEVNTLYVNTSDGSVKYWNGAAYQEVVKPTATTIDSAGDNLHFPTTKAIVDYVTKKIQDVDLSSVTNRLDIIEQQISVINGEEEGSIKKALADAKAYSDSLSVNYAPAVHKHVIADITDVGTLASKSQVSEAELESKLAAKINKKADKADSLAGYGIEDAYTKNEVDAAVASAVANAPHLKRQIVAELPQVKDANENTIYMVGTGEGSETSSYKEYMLINGKFELIGDSKVDLTNYATKEDVDSAKNEAIGQITTKINLLDAPDAVVEGQYVSSVAQNDGIITVQRAELPVKSVTEGTANGTISVNGSNVAVHGLGAAAYVGIETFATAEQGTKAEQALAALTWGTL